MELDTNYGRELIRNHNGRLVALRVEQRAVKDCAEQAHQRALEQEPYELAGRMLRENLRIKGKKIEKFPGGIKKVYVPLNTLEVDGMECVPRLGIRGQVGWLRGVTGIIELSLILGTEDCETEQRLGRLSKVDYDPIGDRRVSQPPFGFTKYDQLSDIYHGSRSEEAKYMSGIVREAAVLDGLTVLPLEFSTE